MTSYILFFSDASNVFLIPFSNFNDKKQTSITKKRRTFRHNVNVQSHDQEESKLNSTIISNSDIHTFIDDRIIQSPFSESINNETSTIFEQEHYIGTITLIRQAVKIRSLLEFYLFLIAATLFIVWTFYYFEIY